MRPAGIAPVLLALALPTAAQQAQRHDSGEAAKGQIIYSRYCAACHGREGKGDGPVAPGLVRKPVNLRAMASKNGGKFPYEEDAVKRITHYVWSIQKK